MDGHKSSLTLHHLTGTRILHAELVFSVSEGEAIVQVVV